ncbi:MAG: selenocysteine-specific translation elongation factor [Candidatus Obscuribacterales bacterium]|nr:selenocysteine-specific translation elongation factor [Candidatus Obscuribacterales bacterium]
MAKNNMSTTMNQQMPIEYQAHTRFFTIATAGHVDHGKTSLLRRLTGMDPDRLKEEKERQMTTDLGFAYMSLPGDMVLGFVDVPGHGKFLKNMLAGVGGIDLALLVVAADEGPMPQTKQHVRILSMLGISKAIVALSKIDVVEEEAQVDLVREETETLLMQHGIEPIAFCPLSSVNGQGIDALVKTFVDYLKDFPRQTRSDALFLPVDRVFSKSGFGTVITGTLVSGKLAVGDQIYVEPGDLTARVRRLETHGKSIETARQGQRVACNLVVKDGEKLKRGFVLSSSSISPVKSLIVSLSDKPKILKEPLSDRLSDQPIRLYHGTAEYHGYVRWVEDTYDDSQGQSGIAFVALQDGAVASAQDRFVIRLTDDTIYGGIVLLRDRPRWLAKSELIRLSQQLLRGEFDQAVIAFLNDSPQLMLQESQLATLLPESSSDVLAKLKAEAELVTLGDFLLTASSRQALAESLISATKKLLSASEEEDGVALETLRQSLQPKIERAAFQALLQEEAEKQTIIRKGDKVTLPGAGLKSDDRDQLAPIEAKLMEQLAKVWCLEWDELAQQTGIDLKAVKSAIQSLAKRGEVVIVSYDFVASVDRLNEAHQVLSNIWTAKRSIAPTDFRESLETTRKYAMALLQYFDDQKITRRLDSGRVLLKGPAPRNK